LKEQDISEPAQYLSFHLHFFIELGSF